VYAIDGELPWLHTAFGCRQIAVGLTRPWGNFEGVTASGGALSVGGWALDPDSPTSPGTVHVYVDGVGTAISAAGSRPDVGAAFPGVGDAHGFTWSTAVAPGRHTVCAYAIDAQFSAWNTPLGCRTVTT
jgi:hypothetical protein